MNLNDRLALELGRTLLRALTAEAQLAEAQAQLAAPEPEPPKRTRSTARNQQTTPTNRR